VVAQHELEASSKSSGDGIQASEPTTESKQQSVAQIVYSDNRVSSTFIFPLVSRDGLGIGSKM
jgi:hypothetical protein